MDINKLFSELAEYQRIADETQAAIDTIKDTIKEYMYQSDTDTIIGTEHKASYKSICSERFDSKSFKIAYPNMYNKYVRKIETKRFTFV